jgi:hypothetical protein
MADRRHCRIVRAMEGATIGPSLHAALAELTKARRYADAAATDLWQYAIEIGDLCALGLTKSDLRWLVQCGSLAHASEVTAGDDAMRHFVPGRNLAFSAHTCFILRDNASESDRLQCVDFLGDELRSGPPAATKLRLASWVQAAPHWDRTCRTLTVDGLVVKEFREPAPNQETVLAAFEEEDWVVRIDDPLPPRPGQDPKYRLHHTIQRLNRHQQHPLVRFHGDGTGEGVYWKVAEISISPFTEEEDGKRRRAA